jgi:hypothetical protein
LDLKLATSDPIHVSDPTTVARLRDIAASVNQRDVPGVPIEIDTSRAKILRRAANDASNYYFFQGPIRTIRATTFLDRPFLIFRTAVVDLGGVDLAIDIYMDRARFSSRVVPTAGDMVSGTLWLQGYLSETSV